ncbi:MAG: FAD-dependent oxidoreductase [Candidatus Brocadiales bacterium]|nr:FAD-dependent oxidoreductase [Candidatus Brocadiales bacterium]
MNRESSEKITLIVGSGMTGLTAAYTLASAGKKCVLLESEESIGGNCRTYVLDDITLDLGPHVLSLNQDLEGDKLLLKLLDNDVISRKWNVAIHYKGKYWRFPPTLGDLLFYPWKYKQEMIMMRLRKNSDRPFDKNSLQYAFEEKAGHSFYNDFLSTFILKKACLSGDKVHRDWFFRTDRDIYQHKEIPKKGRPLKSWYYPSKGFGTIPQKLWEMYSLAGGETILNCGPVSFEKTKDHIISLKAGNKIFLAEDVIWTGSINELNHLLGAGIPPIKYVDTLTVFLTYNRKKKTPRPFVYTFHPQEDLIFNRIYYPDHIYGEKSLPDREGICLELNNLTGLQNTSDDEILARAVNDIEKMGLFKKTDLRKQQLFRLKECMPVYGLDYETKVQDALKVIHGYRNLYSVGRKGGYFFCLSHSAVSQGLKVAKHLLEGRPEI